MKFIYHYIILIILLFFSLSCKLYKKEFDNPVDYIANNDLDVQINETGKFYYNLDNSHNISIFGDGEFLIN